MVKNSRIAGDDSEEITIETNHGGCKFSPKSTQMLESALSQLLRMIGEKGAFRVNLYSTTNHSDHSNPGFRWKGPTLLGVDGSYYENGQREERVRFYLNSATQRDMPYKESLAKKLKAVEENASKKVAPAPETTVAKQEPLEDTALLPSSSPPAISEAEVLQTFPTDDDLETVISLLEHSANNGYLTTPETRTHLNDLARDWSGLRNGDDLLSRLIHAGMLCSQLKPEGYLITKVVRAAKEAQPDHQKENGESVATPQATESTQIPQDVLNRVVKLLAASQKYDEVKESLVTAKSELTALEQNQPGRIKKFEREQQDALRLFQEKQAEDHRLFLEALAREQEPHKEKVRTLEKQLDPNGELATDRNAYVSIFKNKKP